MNKHNIVILHKYESDLARCLNTKCINITINLSEVYMGKKPIFKVRFKEDGFTTNLCTGCLENEQTNL